MPTIPTPKKKKNIIPFIFSGIGALLVIILFLSLHKIKELQKIEVLKKEKVEKKEKEMLKEIISNNQGFLKIHILPYGKIIKLVTKSSINFNLNDRITPLYASLPAGDYEATIEIGSSKEIVKLNFKIEPGRVSEIIRPTQSKIYENVLENLF